MSRDIRLADREFLRIDQVIKRPLGKIAPAFDAPVLSAPFRDFTNIDEKALGIFPDLKQLLRRTPSH